MISVLKGEAGLVTGTPTTRHSRSGLSVTRCSSRMISEGVWPGKIRQFTTAVTARGSAFSACPPDSMVGMQVVPSVPTYWGCARSVAIASASVGSATTRAIASPTSLLSSGAVRAK